MPFVDIEGKRIFYNDSGEGTPVVFLHNGFYSTATWNPVREMFAEHFRVIDYDRFGYGQSTHYPGEKIEGDIVARSVRELSVLVDTLGLNRFHIVGHCLGGAVALLYASRFPDRIRRIVAESVGYFGSLKSLVQTDMTFVPFERIERALRKKMVAMHGEAYTPRLWSLLRNHTQSYIMREDYDIRSEVRQIKAPLFIINGDRDFYFDVEHPIGVYKALRTNATLWIAPGCGHDVHHDIPEEFAANVVRFLRSESAT
jgi:pimeloyl-ACP methyl ester carboxylesterase